MLVTQADEEEHTMSINTVMVGKGTAIHAQAEGSKYTMCGADKKSRPITQLGHNADDVTCSKCTKAVTVAKALTKTLIKAVEPLSAQAVENFRFMAENANTETARAYWLRKLPA
jgi:hypothetical protein